MFLFQIKHERKVALRDCSSFFVLAEYLWTSCQRLLTKLCKAICYILFSTFSNNLFICSFMDISYPIFISLFSLRAPLKIWTAEILFSSFTCLGPTSWRKGSESCRFLHSYSWNWFTTLSLSRGIADEPGAGEIRATQNCSIKKHIWDVKRKALW